MDLHLDLDRRAFLKGACLAGASLALGAGENPLFASSHNDKRIKIGGFTKELQPLSYAETAEVVAELGWDGIECPVRPGGHVLPERVEDDLPKMVEELEKRDCELLIMATDIHNPSERYTERVLRTAKELGIRYYRLGYWDYDENQALTDQLLEIKPQLRDLSQLNKELDMCGVFQNHSGGWAVGAPVWDIFELIAELDHDYIGAHFDIGHATVEGGYAWRLHYRRMQEMIRAVIVKDFRWQYDEEEDEWYAGWCQIGEGMIRREFFEMLKESEFEGPLTMHFEYPVEGNTEKERIQSWIEGMRKDTKTLRKLLA